MNRKPNKTRLDPPSASFECRVSHIVPGGSAIGRDERGVIFVPGALPGELVQIEAVDRRGGTRHARRWSVLEASPERLPAVDCDVHPACGGCDLLHFSNRSRADALEAMVHDALRRGAKLNAQELECVNPLRSADSPSPRRRVRLTVDDRGRAGFFRSQSHEILPRAHCAAVHPALNAVMEGLAGMRLPTGARLRLANDDRGHVAAAVEGLRPDMAADLAARLVLEEMVHGALWLDDEGELGGEEGDVVLLGEVAPGDPGGPHQSCPSTFTQASRWGGMAIAEEVTAALTGKDPSMDGEATYALELFAGAGHLTLPLARLGLNLVAIEGAPRSVQWLRKNLDRAGFGEVRTLCGEIHGEHFGSSFLDMLEAFPDIVIIDPPRSGIPKFDGILEVLAPAVLVMVSCDLATGARDLAIAKRFGYQLESLTPLDCFERTSHVEWVAVLTEVSDA